MYNGQQASVAGRILSKRLECGVEIYTSISSSIIFLLRSNMVLMSLGARDFSCASVFGQGMYCNKRADFRRLWRHDLVRWVVPSIRGSFKSLFRLRSLVMSLFENLAQITYWTNLFARVDDATNAGRYECTHAFCGHKNKTHCIDWPWLPQLKEPTC